MNDIERIRHIEKTLGIKLNQVSLENLFTENYFLTRLGYFFNNIQKNDFSYKGVRNYSIDEKGNVNGLGLDFCGLFLLEDNYLKNFKYLKKLKLKNTYQSDYSFLLQLENLEELNLSNNNLSNTEFLTELKGLTLLDLSSNNLMNAEFLTELKGLTTLYLSNNKLSNTEFLTELKGLTTLYLSKNNLSNAEFLTELKGLTTLDLSENNLSNAEFLTELKDLTALYLNNNNLSNTEFLTELKGLTTLDLSYNNLTNVEFLTELKGLTTLYLNNNNLTNVEFLTELKGLTSLYLSNNNLTNAEFLTELKGLTTLYLSNNKLSNAEFLTELKGLTSLDLSFNDLTNAEFLTELKGLTLLDLSYNNLTNAEFLTELKGLTTLDLSKNNLSNVEFLTELKSLTTLDLSNNKLSNAEFLTELKGLTTLNLGDINLTNVEFLTELKGLTSLYLNNNRLSNAEFLTELKGLTSLYLNNNKLTNAEFLTELKSLTTLDLTNNKLTNAEFLTELKGLTSLYIYGNSNLDLPENLAEIIDDKKYSSLNKNEINQIVGYYEQLEEEKDYIYEAKVLIVGEPQAGKTTLTQKTKDNEKWLREMKGKKTESTVGINIDIFPFPYHQDKSKSIKAHFWDFGGHTAQYVLHQYFFTESSLYVLLADGRKEFPNFNYWFEIIATLGKDCPVLVVLNENASKPIQTFNITEYRREYGEVLKSIEERSVDFYNDADGRFEALKFDIQTRVCNLKHIGRALPAKWVKVREEIEELSKDKAYIEKEEYVKICEKHKLTKKEYQEDVLDNLHILGIALNYKSDINLRNKLILRPNWVIDALYVVLKDTKIVENKGEFEVAYVDSLWGKEGYSSKDCDILLLLMQKDSFEIAYRIGTSNTFIVPILLPYKPIDYTLEEVTPIQMQIQYTFMPKGIISRLIVRLHKNIVVKNEQIVWNKGVLLIHHDSIAEVIETEQSKQISIKVVGKNRQYNKELLTIIRNEIVSIHRDWFKNRLKFEELVPCVCDECKRIKLKFESLTDDEVKKLSEDERKRLTLEPYQFFNLQERLRKNKMTIECHKSFENVSIYELLQSIYITEKLIDKGQSNIIISNLNGNNISSVVDEELHHSAIENLVK